MRGIAATVFTYSFNKIGVRRAAGGALPCREALGACRIEGGKARAIHELPLQKRALPSALVRPSCVGAIHESPVFLRG